MRDDYGALVVVVDFFFFVVDFFFLVVDFFLVVFVLAVDWSVVDD
jgi:hypothetical protein